MVAVAADGDCGADALASGMPAGPRAVRRAGPPFDHEGDGDEVLAGEQREELDEVVRLAFVDLDPGVGRTDAEEPGGMAQPSRSWLASRARVVVMRVGSLMPSVGA